MSAARPSSRARAISMHRERWGVPDFVVRAPGRVNLIGEHTDYNEGFVLPMALPFDTVIAISRVSGNDVSTTTLCSEGFGTVELGADGPSWAAPIQGMHRVLAAEGIVAPPWRGSVATDIPTGASLSSSAAIEIALGLAIVRLAGESLSGVALARCGQRVETELLGQPSGIMDQLISATAAEGCATLIDCRSLLCTPAPLPTATSIVVMDTMTRRDLVDSEFAARMTTCRRAAELLGVPALRDADDVAGLRDGHELEWRRARHVVAENERTIAAHEAMLRDDPRALGALMSQSHDSLRDLFEVSGKALDTIVEIASSTVGCLGARMTGGGFAGCAVALVETDAVPDFIESVAAGFAHTAGTHPRLWNCRPAPGASIEMLGAA